MALMATLAAAAGLFCPALIATDIACPTRCGAAMTPHQADDSALACLRKALAADGLPACPG